MRGQFQDLKQSQQQQSSSVVKFSAFTQVAWAMMWYNSVRPVIWGKTQRLLTKGYVTVSKRHRHKAKPVCSAIFSSILGIYWLCPPRIQPHLCQEKHPRFSLGEITPFICWIQLWRRGCHPRSLYLQGHVTELGHLDTVLLEVEYERSNPKIETAWLIPVEVCAPIWSCSLHPHSWTPVLSGDWLCNLPVGSLPAPIRLQIHSYFVFIVVVQSLSRVWLFVTPWTAPCQASSSFTLSWTLLRFTSIESVMLSNCLILCRPLLLLPSIFPSIRVFSKESVLCIRWPKYWRFSFSISPSSEYSGLISFRIDWFHLRYKKSN